MGIGFGIQLSLLIPKRRLKGAPIYGEIVVAFAEGH
jgi:hypothetical protein